MCLSDSSYEISKAGDFQVAFRVWARGQFGC
jgi:hypothetical protein